MQEGRPLLSALPLSQGEEWGRGREGGRALRCSLQSPCCLPLSQGEEWGRGRGGDRALRCSLQSPCCLPLSQGEEWGRGRGGALGLYAVVYSLPAVCLCTRARSGGEGEGGR